VKHVRFVVLDEADRLLSNAYQGWVSALRQALYFSVETEEEPTVLQEQLFHTLTRRPLQRLLFSATLADNPRKLAMLDVRNPQVVRASMHLSRVKRSSGGEVGDVLDATNQYAYTLPHTLSELLCVSDTETRAMDLACLLWDMCFGAPSPVPNSKRPVMEDKHDAGDVITESAKRHKLHCGICCETKEDMILIFASSVDATHRLCRLLQLINGQIDEQLQSLPQPQPAITKKRKQSSAGSKHFFGGTVAEISSSLTQAQRSQIMEQASTGNIRILVCSDQLARGIDIAHIKCVVNYDMPAFAKVYVHRYSFFAFTS
jgi:ATP-dependent RNA helicase DDX51/DBP6